MRILHVIPSFAPAWRYGGPIYALAGLTRELARQGHTVNVITTNIDGPGVLDVPTNEYLDRDGVQVCYCEIETPRQWYFSRYMWSLLKTDVPKFDVVHIHSLFLWPTASASRISGFLRIPYLIRPAGALDFVCLNKKYERLGWISRFRKSAYLNLLGRRELRNAAAIHFTSELEKANSWLPPKAPPAVIVPLGVDAKPPTSGSSICLRQKYPQLSNRKLVLFLSRLDPKKGLDVLLPSIADLMQRRDDFGFVIAGGGSEAYREQVSKAIREPAFGGRAVMIGEVRGNEKWDVLSQSDVFVLASYQENFGLAVVEAMAAGVPVVISDAVNIYREIERAKAGLVVPVNQHLITAALDSLLSDDGARVQMAQNGRRLVEERYKWDEVARQMVDVYKDVSLRTRSSYVVGRGN